MSKKKQTARRLSALEQKRLSAEKAMPGVKRLVKEYGRTTIGYCLNQLKEYENKLKQLEKTKREVVELEKELKA